MNAGRKILIALAAVIVLSLFFWLMDVTDPIGDGSIDSGRMTPQKHLMARPVFFVEVFYSSIPRNVGEKVADHLQACYRIHKNHYDRDSLSPQLVALLQVEMASTKEEALAVALMKAVGKNTTVTRIL